METKLETRGGKRPNAGRKKSIEEKVRISFMVDKIKANELKKQIKILIDLYCK